MDLIFIKKWYNSHALKTLIYRYNNMIYPFYWDFWIEFFNIMFMMGKSEYRPEMGYEDFGFNTDKDDIYDDYLKKEVYTTEEWMLDDYGLYKFQVLRYGESYNPLTRVTPIKISDDKYILITCEGGDPVMIPVYFMERKKAQDFIFRAILDRELERYSLYMGDCPIFISHNKNIDGIIEINKKYPSPGILKLDNKRFRSDILITFGGIKKEKWFKICKYTGYLYPSSMIYKE